MKIALLISGGLGLRVLNHLLESNQNIACIFTNKSSEQIVSEANNNDIPLFVGNPRNTKGATFLKKIEVDLILSVNYLFIIERDLFSQAKLACNIHGSLLPKYRGRTPHVWAIINNESKTGITAHLIDDGCDTGDILEQIEVPIGPTDTGADILEKYNSLYIPLVDRVLHNFSSGSIKTQIQDHSKASFFGKRTPEDGEINWSWHKERIVNWVRAQAHPYPGAFTSLNGEKLIIDQVEISPLGFSQEQRDGLVLSVNPFCVKTPNGALHLKKVRDFKSTPKLNQILGK